MADKKPTWSIKGELALNCSCDVFCPCVVALGKAPPTEGYCHAWMAVRIDEGKFGRKSLKGLNVALLLDIPGKMGYGDWKAAAYIDQRADDAQYDALMSIFTGQAGGTTGVLMLVAGIWQFTPVKDACLIHCRHPISFLLGHWREGTGGAFPMGLHHGLYCVGCCIAFMGLMFVFGAMNVLWMAVIAAYFVAEKTAPAAEIWSRWVGIFLCVAGVATLAYALI